MHFEMESQMLPIHNFANNGRYYSGFAPVFSKIFIKKLIFCFNCDKITRKTLADINTQKLI